MNHLLFNTFPLSNQLIFVFIPIIKMLRKNLQSLEGFLEDFINYLELILHDIDGFLLNMFVELLELDLKEI